MPGGVQRPQRRHRLALVAQLGVRVVLEHRHLEAARQRQQLLAALEREHGAGGVLEGGQGVDELGPEPRQRALEHVGAHAVLVGGHADEARPRAAEGLQRADEGRLLDDDGVARVEEDARREVEALLRAGQHHHLGGRAAHAARRHHLRQRLAQRRESLGGAVQQGGGADVGEDLGEQLAQLVEGQQVRGGHAEGERDDVGALGEAQQVADQRVLEARGGGAEELPPGQLLGAVHPPGRAVERGDDGAAPDVGVDERVGAQFLVGDEHGAAADPQRLCEAALRRQPEAGREPPRDDEVADLPRDLPVDGLAARPVDRQLQRTLRDGWRQMIGTVQWPG